MNILVCFKLLPEPDRVLQEDYEGFSLETDLSYAGMDFSAFDSSALELGLRLKDQVEAQGGRACCRALTLGKTLPDSFALRLYSAGFDQVEWIPAEHCEFNSFQVAKALSEAAGQPDVILTGREAGYGESRLVPFLLADHLGYSIHQNVEEISFSEGGFPLCCRNEKGLSQRREESRFVAAVGNSPAVLRASTLRQQLRFRGKQPVRLPEAGLQAPSEISFSVPNRMRTCRMLDKDSSDTYQYIKNLFFKVRSFENRQKEKRTEIPQALQKAVEEKKLYLYPDTEGGRILAVRKANEMGIPCFFGGRVLELSHDTLELQKNAFGSNVLWKQRVSLPLVLTGDYPGQEAEILEVGFTGIETKGLAQAPAVLICGNGMGSRDLTEKARALAEKLGAGFGLTRPGALNAWGSTQEIVGQSGQILAPQICMTLGAAGAGAFLVGIENAGTILAVNRDPNALIFKSADYGVLTDVEDFLEKLSKEVENDKN